MIEDMLRLHLRHIVETEAVDASERAVGQPMPGAREIGVAFADLVGFTRLGEAVAPEELGPVARRLAVAGPRRGGRPGPDGQDDRRCRDAGMSRSRFRCSERDAPTGRRRRGRIPGISRRSGVGMAFGEAVSRAGDWFGSPVNRASRVTAAARPGTVLVGAAAREAIGDAEGFEWSYAGSRQLKGIKDDTKLYRARRAAS